MENGITCGNTMMEKPSHISPVKYAAAYSTKREHAKETSATPMVSLGSDHRTSTIFLYK